VKFSQGLNEYSDDIPLEKWNIMQKQLWFEVCSDLNMNHNDMDKFIQFASFFDRYYKANRSFPTTKQIEAVLGESLFVRTGGHQHEIHSEKRNQYADKKLNKKNKKSSPKVQRADKTVHMKDYMKTIKSGGKKPYLTWVNNIKGKI
jgi:hypothetical protein